MCKRKKCPKIREGIGHSNASSENGFFVSFPHGNELFTIDQLKVIIVLWQMKILLCHDLKSKANLSYRKFSVTKTIMSAHKSSSSNLEIIFSTKISYFFIE